MKPLICCMIAVSALAQAPPRARSASSNTIVIRNGGSYLGVAVVEVDSDRAKALKLREERGVEVKVVDDGSPAAKAGIKPDDVILEFNGQRVEGLTQFIRMVSETPVGRKATLSVMRGGAPLTLTAVIETRNGTQMGFGQLPPMPGMPPMPPMVVMPDLPRAAIFFRNGMLGIETEPLNPQLAEYFGVKEGVLVRMVTRQSPAEKAGVKAGDVIVKAAGKPVAATRDISALLRDRKPITLGIVRNHKDVTLDVSFDGS